MNKVIKKYKSWNKIPWGLIQTEIFNLQYKIFRHAKQDEIGKRTEKLQWVHAHCHDQIHS